MNSRQAEQVLRDMRERAVAIENNPTLNYKAIHKYMVKLQKQRKLDRAEIEKKIYFNAGRWAGGARDHVAREAFEKMNKLESK